MYRLLTKLDRDNSRQIQFDSLVKNGYQKTEYKNLVIFHHPENLLLKTFWGNAANHTDFFKYRTIEQITAKIETLKANADNRETWKAEQKEKNKGYKSNHAGAAASIKAELKKQFPFTKFSVKSEGYSMGDSVRIYWTDGPQVDSVEKISSKYQYGSFNGMEDIYEYTNNREDIPQAKYVFEDRTLSDELTELVKVELMKIKHFTDEEIKSYRNNPTQEARQLLYKTDIPATSASLQVVINEDDNCNDRYKIVFEVEETKEVKDKVKTKIEVPAGKIQIVDYSEKAFAVIGETKPLKDGLKELGGKFNFRLTCGAGWIFSKTKLEAIKAFLIQSKEQTTEQPQPEGITQPTTQIEPICTIEEKPETYDNLQDMEAAVKSGKVVSLYNMSQLINAK